MKQLTNLAHTFRAKYLSHDIEKNINREEFILRVILAFIICTLIWACITYFFPRISPSDIENFKSWEPVSIPWHFALMNILWLVVYGIFYWILMELSIKRYADFNQNWRTPKILIPVFYGLNAYSLLLGIYAGYFGNPVIRFLEQESISSMIYASGVDSLMMWSLICIWIMMLSLMFRPGKEKINSLKEE